MGKIPSRSNEFGYHVPGLGYVLGCPFCGHPPKVEVVRGGRILSLCGNEKCGLVVSTAGSNKFTAVEMWNRRTGVSQGNLKKSLMELFDEIGRSGNENVRQILARWNDSLIGVWFYNFFGSEMSEDGD